MLGCSDDDNGNNGEYPREQTATINLFEDNTATVKGYLTDTQWSGLANKIEAAINAVFEDGIPPVKGRFRGVFNLITGDKVTITIESNAAYESYEADNRITLRFNFDWLSTVSDSDLQTTINAAVTEMDALPLPTNP
jgi:hypothetical protein